MNWIVFSYSNNTKKIHGMIFYRNLLHEKRNDQDKKLKLAHLILIWDYEVYYAVQRESIHAMQGKWKASS